MDRNMTRRKRTNARYVRCPRCSSILSESAEVPLYTCGGCDTTLQATYYRRGDGRMRTGSKEQGHVQNDEADHVPDERKSSSSNQKPPSDDQHYLEQDGGTKILAFTLKQLGVRDSEASTSSDPSPLERKAPTQQSIASDLVQMSAEIIVRSDNPEQLAVTDSGITASLSKKHNLFESEKLLRFVKADGVVGRMDENINAKSSQEQLAIKNFAMEASLSNDPTLNRSADSLSKVEGIDKNVVENYKEEQLGVASHTHETMSSNDPMPIGNINSLQLAAENAAIDIRINQDELEDARQTQLGGDSRNPSSSEIHCYKRHSTLAEARANKKASHGEDQHESTGCVVQKLRNISLSSEAVQSTDFNWEENRCSPSSLEANMKVDKNSGDPASPSTGEIHSGCIASEPEFEKDPIELTRNRHQQTHKAENKDDKEFKCRSCNTLASTELVKAKLQVDTRNSLTYEGRISSMDGNDDKFLGQNLHLYREASRGTCEVEECIGAKDKCKKFLTRNMTHVSSDIQYQPNNSPAASPNKKNEHHRLKARMSTIDGSLEGTRHCIQRNTMRPQRGEFPSKVPVSLRSSGVGHEPSSFSHYMHDEYSRHLRHHLPLRYSDPKSSFGRRYTVHNENVDRTFPKAPAEIYHDLRYQGYYGRKRLDISPHSIARIPYSGEAISSFHHVNGLHCHPDAMRWASYLPPPAICCSSGQFVAHRHHGSWSQHDSLWSRQRFTDPEAYGWGHYAFSDDQRHRDHIRRKLYLRKKNQPVQRHFRPIAGGAPFVTCNECTELLELPTDHLLFRRSHRLKCGKCSRVLKFSLENGCRLVPYTPKSKQCTSLN